jgi:hypothetical protein
MRQVIFNVGGALSTYIEVDNKLVIIDLGKSSDFNPITDFLKPLFLHRRDRYSSGNNDKLHIDQLIISHPHADHISAISDFDNTFYPELLTCPNDNAGMAANDKINWNLFTDSSELRVLKKMLSNRKPPLRAILPQCEFLYFLPPRLVEQDVDLSSESYCNNISIAVFFIIHGHRIFLPGDLQKVGMERILEREHLLRNKLSGGVDILIAPHHGLRSSFSELMFRHFSGLKTKRLNIVSEKPNTDDKRFVDSRYASTEYCLGSNNLSSGDSVCCQVKTSRGHIFVDYSPNSAPTFEIITDIDELMARFE